MEGVFYTCYDSNAFGIEKSLQVAECSPGFSWCNSEYYDTSPSESFSLFSFWLGRDSDALLEWPPKPTSDFSFAYLEQD